MSPTRSALVSARPSAVQASRSSRVRRRDWSGTGSKRHAGRKRADRACEVGAVARAVGLRQREAVAVAFGDQDVRRDGTLRGMVDGEDRRVRRRARHHRGVDQIGREGDDRAVDRAHARTAGEIRGEDRARERNVGDGLSQSVGDDGRLDPAGERIAVARVVAQLEPAGVAHRRGEALASLAVVEIGHGARSELASQPARGAPQLGLFGRVADIHG